MSASPIAAPDLCRHCAERRITRPEERLCTRCHNRSTVRPCRRCGHARVLRGRGLCGRCWNEPGVREQYSRGCDWSEMGNPQKLRRPLPPPTRALPGTREKVEVLEERARLGQQLFHPLLDAVLDKRDE
jgi:hypothetical protein